MRTVRSAEGGLIFSMEQQEQEFIDIEAKVRVRGLMEERLITVSPGDMVTVAAGLMADHGIGSCIVCEGGKPVGIITEQDISRKVVAVGLSPASVPVSVVMASPLITVDLMATAGEAAEIMVRHHIRRLPVTRNGEVAGIVTARTLLVFASEMNRILQDIAGISGTLMFLEPDMRVLWANHPGSAARSGEESFFCYELLHGAQEPCRGCPVAEGGACDARVQAAEVTTAAGKVFEVRCHPVEGASGAVIGIIESAVDITPQRELERKLRQNRERLSLAMEGAHLATWYVNLADGEMVMDDPTGMVTVAAGAPSGPALATFISGDVHPEDRGEVEGLLCSLVRGEAASGEIKYRSTANGGDGWRWMRTICRVIEAGNGGRPCVIAGANMDVTDLQTYQEAILRANRKLNLLSSVTRHDILNQVTAIRMTGELIAMDGEVEETSPLGVSLERIFNATASIEKQIRFTGDYQDLGVTSPEWQDVCQVTSSVARDPAYRDIAVTCACRGVEIYADPMFAKVVYNLLDNALRHGDGVTAVTVTGERSGDGFILTVADDGRGIPEDRKERIFERGYGENTGFGLFLTREILDLTGIAVRETGVPGEGARFVMTVPEGMYRVRDA